MAPLQNKEEALSWGAVTDVKQTSLQSRQAIEGQIGAAMQVAEGSAWAAAETWYNRGSSSDRVDENGKTLVANQYISGIDMYFTEASGGNNDTAGLDIPGVQQRVMPALTNYINAIINSINKLENADEARKAAFKGEVGDSVGRFINAIRDHLIDVASRLRKFEDRLGNVVTKYGSMASNLSSDITAQASVIQDSVERIGE